MAGMIPEDIIEQVRQSSDIVEIVGSFVRLKKRGRNFLALCPFHTEKTPSFSVSPDKQIYHCFGCGKGGNVFTFLMEHENMTFVEAVKYLAKKAGIRIPERQVDPGRKEELERLHYANQLALEYFKKTLRSDRYYQPMMNYLKEKRGLTEEIIDHFHIGLAGESWDGYLKYALDKGLFQNELVRAGLVIHNEEKDSYYDRFRKRLMIPIFNLSEKPIAFGGRTLEKGERAKYINSPETVLYSKSSVLYGLNFSRQDIREKNEVIIVEGYFDVISLYQAGVKNVVASSGTAFTPQQARLLARFAEMAYLFFDADSAGQTAALRSVDALYDAGLEVMVMSAPEGEDPDSIAMKDGAEGIEKIKEQALGFLDFRFKNIDLKNQGIIAKEKLIKELAELAGRIGDTTRRQIFLAEAANKIGSDVQNFYNALSGAKTGQKGQSREDTEKPLVDVGGDFLSLLINYPDYIDMVQDKIAPGDFQSELHGKLFTHIVDIYREHGALEISRLIDAINDPETASKITGFGNRNWEIENPERIIRDYLRKILEHKRERNIDKLKAQLKMAEDKNDSDEADRLTREIADLIKRRQS